jgi:hypothetical protein
VHCKRVPIHATQISETEKQTSETDNTNICDRKTNIGDRKTKYLRQKNKYLTEKQISETYNNSSRLTTNLVTFKYRQTLLPIQVEVLLYCSPERVLDYK